MAWIRQHPQHLESMVVAANCNIYQITQDDVDHVIVAEYTPVSAAGISGDKATASTAIVQSTGKIIMSCSISSQHPKVGRHIEVDFAVAPGAASTIQWYVYVTRAAFHNPAAVFEFASTELSPAGMRYPPRFCRRP